MSAAPPAAGLPPAPAATPPVATAPEIAPPTPVVAEPPVVAAPPVAAEPPVATEPPVAVPPPADPPVVATPPVVTPPPAPVAPPPAPVAPPPAVVNAPPPQAPPPPVVGVPPPVVDVSPPPPVTSPPPPAVTPDAPPPSVTPPTPGNAPPSPSESPPPPSPSEPPPPPSPAAPPPEETAAPPPPGTRAPPLASVSPPPVVLSPPGASASPPPPPPLPPSGPTPSKDSKISNGVVAGIAAGGGLLALLALVLLFVFCRKRKNKKNVLPYAMAGGAGGGGAVAAGAAYKAGGMDDRKAYAAGGNARLPPGGGVPLPPEGSPSVGNSRTWFTYEELHAATNGFATANLLGEGGFGRVYKGELPDGQVVAVKQLTIGGGQGEREFRAEVEIISRVHHRHLVSLVGYCIADKQRLLVYDFVPNGTLDVNLYGKGKPVMDWETRVRVALGAARGLAYLHEDCHPRIIHRDIKSSNILLDDKYEAQVADFGLAKLASDTHTHVSTRVMGTFGYLAPEYAQSGKLTEKSDVYSFGVVLLELITGRKPIDQSNQESLVEWGRPLMTYAMEDGDVDDLVDPRLDGNYDSKEMFRMIEVAASCVRHTASKRPKMGQVVRALESEEENAGLYTGLRPGMSSEHESDFDRYAGSDYDTQAFNADMLRSGTSSVFRGSSSELEPIFPKAAETRIDVRASGPVSVRTGRSSLPSIRGASGRTMDSYTSLPPTRAAPPRPGQASDSDNSDMFMPPPPPPPNFSDELYAPIDFNPGIRDGR